MKKMASIRWAFNLAKWEPTEQEFSLASACIQSEEKERLGKFVFKKDLKASLVGRLLMRKFVSEYTGVPYNALKISRDANNKPFHDTTDPTVPTVSFNVSHHGSFAVLAGETEKKDVGVDVMKLEYTGGKPIEEFFRIMNRNFTVLEWRKIKNAPEAKRVDVFCRNWALKESYVKATGTGITIDLRDINFRINSDLQEDKITLDTDLYINNLKQPWVFEESLLDSEHCVSVALKYDGLSEILSEDLLFKKLSSAELLKNAVPLLPQDTDYCRKYFARN